MHRVGGIDYFPTSLTECQLLGIGVSSLYFFLGWRSEYITKTRKCENSFTDACALRLCHVLRKSNLFFLLCSSWCLLFKPTTHYYIHTATFAATLASLRLALWIPGLHVASRSKNIALKIKALSRTSSSSAAAWRGRLAASESASIGIDSINNRQLLGLLQQQHEHQWQHQSQPASAARALEYQNSQKLLSTSNQCHKGDY